MNDAINSVRSLAARYTIERELGSGATATVFLGWDVKHKRHVAVKILKPEVTVTLGAERFLREIETTANLRHPHIVPLYDSGEARGALYYVMPFVEGESLRQRLTRDGQLPLDDAIRIAREVAGALSYAHARGIVHRDIKPENILLESGHAVVTDFGIARAVREAGTESLTGAGISLGTPAYMSPEQAAGEREVDGRTDLYSLGCVLYEMLGGQPPFTGPSMPSIIRQHLVAEPRPIATLRPTVPAPVWAALERALAKNPADRFGLVSQFADALRPADPAAVSTMPVSTMPVSTTPLSTPALPTTTPPTASPRPHTERLLLTISVVLAVVLVLVVAFAVWQSTSR